ncbi:glycosyltransferase family 4 protein [Paenibacillus sp. 11B]|uniref:glycosyltransferase family 4 protein n=1 Tax=unclassified Paenibacillus TaxID=185978 RepID=UPI00264AB7B3|nr:glycosyltransferase family 4 protein [Paenibacillus sp. 11B]MDN8590291.1 glycosyltransferase family 4 protein [Paenibacillus sp. 11B]
MRICIVNHKFVKGEGQGRVNYEVASEALKQGHKVICIASEVDPHLLGTPNMTWIKVCPSPKLYVLLRHQIFAFQSADHIRRLRNSGQVDVVIVNGFITWAKADITAVHFVHSTWIKSPVHGFRTHPTWRRWYLGFYSVVNSYLERRAFRKSKKIVAVSEKVKSELTQLGNTPDKIDVINNGVDIFEFYPTEHKSKLQLDKKKVVGLFAGGIADPRKNLETVLRAMESVQGFSLVVAGSTYKSIYPQMAIDLKIEDRVHFLGYRNDMDHIMRNVDLFVFPSRYEACSLVVLEALASGIPVIITEESGVTEMISAINEEHQPGFIMQSPDDVEGLSNILTRLVQAPDELKRMGEIARKVALNNTWTNMSQKYLHYCEELINEDGRLGRERNVGSSVEV